MGKLIAIALLLMPLAGYSECLNEIGNERDLLVSNICTYPDTVIVEINTVTLNNKYSPSTYFKNHRMYTLKARVQQVIKGNAVGVLCFLQWREEPFDKVYDMENNTYIVSFKKTDGCSVIEVGSILKVTDELMEVVRSTMLDGSK